LTMPAPAGAPPANVGDTLCSASATWAPAILTPLVAVALSGIAVALTRVSGEDAAIVPTHQKERGVRSAW